MGGRRIGLGRRMHPVRDRHLQDFRGCRHVRPVPRSVVLACWLVAAHCLHVQTWLLRPQRYPLFATPAACTMRVPTLRAACRSPPRTSVYKLNPETFTLNTKPAQHPPSPARSLHQEPRACPPPPAEWLAQRNVQHPLGEDGGRARVPAGRVDGRHGTYAGRERVVAGSAILTWIAAREQGGHARGARSDRTRQSLARHPAPPARAARRLWRTAALPGSTASATRASTVPAPSPASPCSW